MHIQSSCGGTLGESVYVMEGRCFSVSGEFCCEVGGSCGDGGQGWSCSGRVGAVVTSVKRERERETERDKERVYPLNALRRV